MADDATSRDGGGRFSAGNRGGPGRPKGSGVGALRRAVREGVDPEHLRAIVRKATMLALGGNLAAMRFVMDYVLGKPAQALPAPVEQDVQLPALRTAADCSRALDALVDAFCEGTIDQQSMQVLVDAVNARTKAIEAAELEQRITELEKTASAAAAQQMPMRPRRAW